MLNQKGIAHIFLILVLLVGIIATVFLASKTQIFKPRASAENVTWILKSTDPENSCVEVKDGKEVATCPTVKFNLISPLETNQSSDAGFQLVKTAYAQPAIDNEEILQNKGGRDYFCKDDDKSKIYHQRCTLPFNICAIPTTIYNDQHVGYEEEVEDCPGDNQCVSTDDVFGGHGARCQTSQSWGVSEEGQPAGGR